VGLDGHRPGALACPTHTAKDAKFPMPVRRSLGLSIRSHREQTSENQRRHKSSYHFPLQISCIVSFPGRIFNWDPASIWRRGPVGLSRPSSEARKFRFSFAQQRAYPRRMKPGPRLLSQGKDYGSDYDPQEISVFASVRIAD
jgi:hypothetical protein